MAFAGYFIIAVAAYLLGSIPTGFLVGQARGIDIRTVGSGNIGATNALRVLGKPAGILVFLIDTLKGWLAVAVLAPWLAGAETEVVFRVIAAIGAVLGHNYTCWLKFKGGKGIATSAGVLLALVPWALLIIFTAFVVVLLLTRYVSAGSIAASAALPPATWLTTHNLLFTAVTGAMTVLAIYKHKANIQRLLAGTESRLRFGKGEAVK